MGEAESKEALRARMRRVRDALPAGRRAAWSDTIAERVLELPELKGLGRGASVFVYVSFRSEVATHGLIRGLLERGVSVAAPRIVGPGILAPQPVRDLDELVPGPYGILEPGADVATPPPTIGLTLVPGLAFGERGERLGYGAGHYDRWLAANDGGRIVGLAFEAQVVQGIPMEAHDRAMDAVVTESRVIECA